MKKTNKRNSLIIVLIVLLLALAVGYAAFSSTLTVTGSATGSITWDVHFKEGAAKLLQADGSTEDTTHGGAISLNEAGDALTVSGLTFAYPGDGVLLKVVVENSGTIPAKLSGFTITGTDDDFEVTQAAGGPTVNETIAADGTCTATFLVKWKTNSTATTLGTKSFTITYNYDQGLPEFTGNTTHTH